MIRLCKISITLLLMMWCSVSFGQSRKYISNFSFFQSYYNPGLTGYEGSAMRGFVRNQWSGMEGAPKTMFFSTELDFGEMSGIVDPALMGKNAMSVNLLFDSYGAFNETEVMVSYASRIRISESHNLRLGAGVNYTNIRLDGLALSTEQQSDNTLSGYLGSFADMQILDFNLGMALTRDNYYISYGLHNVNRGRFSTGDNFMEGKPMAHMVQAGLRGALSDNVSLIGNGFFRQQEGQPDNIEFNAKVLFIDKLWLGAGHRVTYANNFQAGFILPSLRIGYLYELPIQNSGMMSGNIHEFMVIFHLFRNNDRVHRNEILIW